MIPTLKTSRLILDAFTLADGPRVEQLAGDPRVALTTANIPHPYPAGASVEWIAGHLLAYVRGHGVAFAVRLGDGALIGCVSLGVNASQQQGELGYWLGADYWNQGYTTEASRACVAFGFERFGLVKITARHSALNPASGRVMEKLGMEKEGYLRKHFRRAGVFHDIIEYALIR